MELKKHPMVGLKYEILDQGYIILVDYMGSDDEIAQAARVSYDTASTTKTSSDAGLLDYLLRHKHTSPFEMATLKFEIKLPIFVERQWVRHRTCSMNEMSARYSELPEEYYVPEDKDIRSQSTSNKQGRDAELDPSALNIFKDHVKDGARESFRSYRQDLKSGVARELARIQLPFGTYTKKVWMMNLHNLFHFLKLRTDSHAQYEIRVYADKIEEIVAELFPISYAAWKNHVKNAISFSEDELSILADLIGEYFNGDKCAHLGKRRAQEFIQKLSKVMDNYETDPNKRYAR